MSVNASLGGSSISGISVSCFSSMENCLEACHMSCYFADHCNDSPGEMVACAPGLTMLVFSIARHQPESPIQTIESWFSCLLPPYCPLPFPLSSFKMDDPNFNGILDKVMKSGIDCMLQRMPWVQKVYDMVEPERCQDVNWTDATMIILTVLFVLFLCCCCCAICFFSPCCICAIWYKKRRDSRNRAAAERHVPQAYPSAPPLLAKV